MDDRDRYYNHLLFRLEQLLYHELSDCASWKTELVGTDFIQTQDIQGSSEPEIIEACIEKLGYATTYLADMKVDAETGQCVIRAAIYATPEKIGEVSDWSKE